MASLIGARVRRVEDPRFLRGRGRYVEDLESSDALHVAFVRGVYGHARIRGIDTRAAAGAPGVVAVETAGTLGPANGPFPHPTWFPPTDDLARQTGAQARPESIVALAVDRTRYVGEAVAVVVATSRYLAADAARLVDVDYEPLPVVVDPAEALGPDAPLLNPDWGTNLAASFRVVKGDPAAAFERADVVVRGTFSVPRAAGAPIETRGVLAMPDRATGGLTIWSANQSPHWLRNALSSFLGLAHEQVRVVAPDVGGGFGVKSMVYPEEMAVAILALRLGRPVRWTDGRQEHLLTTIQARGQRHEIELAVRADGTFEGLRDDFLVDGGASNVENLVSPWNTAAHLQGPYRIPHAEIACRVALTNKAPMSAYRGAGRPEAVFAIERIIDQAARALGMDRAELRRRNTLRRDEMPYVAGIPYRDGVPMVVDGGDFAGCLEIALDAIGWDRHLAAPLDGSRRGGGGRRPDGKRRGVGVAAYIEGTGIGPYEIADVLVEPTGDVVVAVGLPSQGQGHETTLAQICAAQLGVPLERVRVVQGDTRRVPFASGTIASRTAVVVGNAVGDGARRVRGIAIAAAAELLEAAPGDLVLANGRVHVAGSPERCIELATLAARMAPGQGRPVGGSDGPLQARGWFDPASVTFSNGVHAVEVDVDPATGHVDILRYVVAHDCGTIINPTVLDGQISGGVAQGIGAALLEELVYDEQGQLLTGTFADYLLPGATDVPAIETHHLATPSTRNPLGIKGAGEAGTIPVQAAIAGAVEDALADGDVIVSTCPLTPARVWELASGIRRRESAP